LSRLWPPWWQSSCSCLGLGGCPLLGGHQRCRLRHLQRIRWEMTGKQGGSC
jgi:hypothetical protein